MPKKRYIDVAERLAAQIEDGTYPAGSYLPSIPELAKRFGVAQGTVRSAQKKLRELGYLYSEYIDGHKRSAIRDRTKVDLVVTDSLDGIRTTERKDVFAELAERLGKEASKSFSMAVIPAPEEVAWRLDIPKGQLVVQRRLVQKMNNEPWGIEEGYYPLDLAQELGLDAPSDIPEGTIRVLERGGYKDAGAVDELFYWPVGQEESKVLDLPIGASLIGRYRTVASSTRITRVMRYGQVAQNIRLVWRLGSASALGLIDAARSTEETS